MISLTALAAMLAEPAFAGDADMCRSFAVIAYNGAVDGMTMEPLIDGVEEAITGAGASGDLLAERITAGAYLVGYSQGLMFIDPAETASEFFAGCVSEGV